MQIEPDVREVIVETLSVKPEEVKPDQSLEDSLGVDSTEIVDLRVALEKKFGVKIEAKEVTKACSPKDIANMIEGKQSTD